MASDWTVLVFGDSWVDDNFMHPGFPSWPQVLAQQRLRAKVFNFAQSGSMCDQLPDQGRMSLMHPQVPKAPGGLLRKETLVVIHTGGNDFIGKIAEAVTGMNIMGLMRGFMGGGEGMPMNLGGGMAPGQVPELLKANPGQREVEILRQFMESMYVGGARHFFVSGVPAFIDMPAFNMAWPLITNMVNQGKLEDLGVSPGDPPRLVMEVQTTALHERWEELCSSFSKAHSDVQCVFFDEVASLERLRLALGAANFDSQMWDFTMFHPSVFGHQQLASEAHLCLTHSMPALAALAPHPDVPVEARAAAAAPPTSGQEAKVEPMGPTSSAAPVSAAPPANAATAAAAESEPVKIRVESVKGDVFFLECSKLWTAQELKANFLARAPESFGAAGAQCVLAFKGTFLKDGPETLAALGIEEGSKIIAVLKRPSSAKPAS